MSDRDVQRWLEHAEDMRCQGNYDACIESLRRVLSLDPDHAGAHGMMSLALLAQRRIYAAEFEAGAALALDPGEPLSHFAMGAILLARRKLDQASEHIETVLGMEPDDPANYRLKAELCGLQNRRDEVGGLLDQALHLDPSDPFTLTALGEHAYQLGEFEQARDYAERALFEQPEHIDANVLRGRLYLRNGEVFNAQESALFALSIDAESREALQLLAAIKAHQSPILGLWWRFSSMFDSLTETQTFAVLLGSFVVYRLVVIMAEHFNADLAASIVTVLWVGFCAYTWIAPSLFRRWLARDLDEVELSDDF